MALPLRILNDPSSTPNAVSKMSARKTPDFDNYPPSMSAVPRREPRKSMVTDKETRTSPIERHPALTSDNEDDSDESLSLRSSTAEEENDGHGKTVEEQVYLDVSSVPAHIPTHPLKSMQGPFEESMLDAGRKETTSSNYRESKPDKFKEASRRSLILTRHGDFDNISYNAQWRADKEQKYHPITKIISQVVFGIHLLCQAMEQSVPEVSTILKGFIQELDGFLRRANGDLDLSLKDVNVLHGNLALPLQHVNVFDQLLNDRRYRTQTLEGNVRIEANIKRYSRLVEDYTVDLQKLNEANIEFGAYLARIGDGWTRGQRELIDIHSAMCQNTAIWDSNVKLLLGKATTLSRLLSNCALCVFEFEKRCAAAARRSMVSCRPPPPNAPFIYFSSDPFPYRYPSEMGFVYFSNVCILV
jgi:hypothetical protein